MILCSSSGAFIAPAAVQYWSLNWIYAGCLGMVAGILCIPAVAGIKLIGERFAIKPEKFIPQIGNAMKVDTPDPDVKKGGVK
jgi:hypothetical protein